MEKLVGKNSRELGEIWEELEMNKKRKQVGGRGEGRGGDEEEGCEGENENPFKEVKTFVKNSQKLHPNEK